MHKIVTLLTGFCFIYLCFIQTNWKNAKEMEKRAKQMKGEYASEIGICVISTVLYF